MKQEGDDIAGGGIAARDNTEDTSEDEEDAAHLDDPALVMCPVDVVVGPLLTPRHKDDDTNLTEDGDDAESYLKTAEKPGCFLIKMFLLISVFSVYDNIDLVSVRIHLC